jgi:hypothetical protein
VPYLLPAAVTHTHMSATSIGSHQVWQYIAIMTLLHTAGSAQTRSNSAPAACCVPHHVMTDFVLVDARRRRDMCVAAIFCTV